MRETRDQDMPGVLLPLGHLINARRGIQRYVESGSVQEAGAVLDELDELRALLLDVAGAFSALAADAQHTPGTARRNHKAIAAAGDALRELVAQDVQPVALRLLGEAVVPSGVRRGEAA